MYLLENNTLGEDDFVLLLEDRGFVDYFNLYQSLPIFGQHVIYNFIEKEFSYEPPITEKKNYVDRKEVVRWLCKKRFPGFYESCLFMEYVLCTKLRDLDIYVYMQTIRIDDDMDRSVITRNIIGSATGMRLFREFLIGTSGEKCYRCWLDLERLRRMPPGEIRQRLILYIRNNYLADGADYQLDTAGREAVFEGKLNFEVIPESELQKELIGTIGDGNVIYRVNTMEALQDLQRVLYIAIRLYWLPRYLVNFLKTVPKKYVPVIKRTPQFETSALLEQRQLRCKHMFPTIYSGTATPATQILESIVDGEFRDRLPTPKSASTSRSSKSMGTFSPHLSASDELMDLEEVIRPSDFLTIAGGGQLEPIEIRYPTSTTKESLSFLDFGSVEARSREPRTPSPKEGEDFTLPNFKAPSYTALRKSIIIPPALSIYISGRKRVKTGNKNSNKVMCALASDKLAGRPMSSFLSRKNRTKEKRLLEFWTDVREYLDTEESCRDHHGNLAKQELANRIYDQYLTTEGEDLFPEDFKMTVFLTLSQRDDMSLLCLVQDFVTGTLKTTWKTFMFKERRAFYNAVCKEKHLERNVLEYPENSTKGQEDPLMYLNTSQGINLEELSPEDRDKSGSLNGDDRPWSRLSDASPVSLTEEQVMKAFEMTVMLAEYGRPVVYSFDTPNISDVVDVLYSDYGSLHINKRPPARNAFLYKLTQKPKIDIEKLKVSRVVFLDKPVFGTEDNNRGPLSNRMALRREGITIERPPRPRTLLEVLYCPVHYEFFKRFMVGHKMPYPLGFWRNVEELRDEPDKRTRQSMINNIRKKYFSRAVKFGALLDCQDDIIRQVASMDKVEVGVLTCAQASVFRAMEAKWFPMYQDTYPPEDDRSDYDSTTGLHDDHAPRSRRKRRKTLHLWQSFVSTIICFLDSMKNPQEIRLLELYMRKEFTKEIKRQTNKQKSTENKFARTPSISVLQTRIVLRNKLVIMDKLPMDLRFWCDVNRYVNQVDLVNRLDTVTEDHREFVAQKAKNIVAYFLDSDILPRNQLNIPSDLAQNITTALERYGATRGLFHDAVIQLFPLLYHYWRKCKKEWLGTHTAKEIVALIEHEETLSRKPSTPHRDEQVPDFLTVTSSMMQIVHHAILDMDEFIINFSLSEGFRIMQPYRRIKRAKSANVRESQTGMTNESSNKNLKEKGSGRKLKKKTQDKERLVSKLTKTDSQPNNTKSRETDSLVDDLLAKSTSPNKKKKMDSVVTAAVRDDMETELFGE